MKTAALEDRIRTVRGRKVILDGDLARIYGVSAKRLNEKYRRNLDRFPEDFTFQLAPVEWAVLRSQFATLNAGRGSHRKYLPLAFTEHDAIMAATILNSPRAVQMSVFVVRAFVKMRAALTDTRSLARKLAAVEAAGYCKPSTFLNPSALSSPALRNFLARSTCRSPIFAFFPSFIRNGMSSRLAITLSSSGTTVRGMI